MKRISLMLAMACSTWSLHAQNETDALRFAWTESPGTARSLGMGGAFGALGADMSSFWVNPGGIGLFRRGGIECTFGFNDAGSSSLYEGTAAENGRANFTIQSFGITGSRASKNADWGPVTFGVAYGKLNNFYENLTIRGTAQNTTLLDVFANQAYGTPSGEVSDAFPFGAGLAWETYLIDPLDTVVHSYVPVASGGAVDQSALIERRGAMSETAFGFGTSYRDRVYFGASISFRNISYYEDNSYTESFGDEHDLLNYTFLQDLAVTGSGIQLKLGVVGRVTDWLRLGAAYHSPTRIGLTDSYQATMTSRFRLGDSYTWSSPQNIANYSLRTPARYVGSAAFILGDAGVISADYEYTDYSNIRMDGTGLNTYDYTTENETIDLVYRGTHRVRTGVEIRIAQAWRARAGAQYTQSPLVSGAGTNTPVIGLSAGGGYRYEDLSIDLSAVHLQRTTSYYFYDPRMVSSAEIEARRLAIQVSVGFRF